MIRTVLPGPREGRAHIPGSKSRAHRLLICAALSRQEISLACRGISRDIEATAACLRALGSEIDRSRDRIVLRPGNTPPCAPAVLRCGESGSTLRFLLPVAGALGAEGEFILEGRLPERPLQPLWDVLCSHGMRLRQEKERLFFSGKLQAGEYEIPGNISSQYISGLLFALPLLEKESVLTVTGPTESADYIAMTVEALEQTGVPLEKRERGWRIPPEGYAGGNRSLSGIAEVEADWSSAAFFLSLGALSPTGVTVCNLNLRSRQGDRRILDLLESFGARVEIREREIHVRAGELRGQRIDASAIPDLVPVLAAVAASARGETRIEHAERLRLKESDRLQSTTAMLSALGAEIRETGDGLLIRGKPQLRGGRVSSFHDHRIAMSAAVAAAACREPVTVEDAECTEKSFPGFWETLEALHIN